MRRKLLRFAVFLLALTCFSTFPFAPAAAQRPPAEGETFPELQLPLPQKVEEREYLKIESGPFRLSQIKTDIVIVEVFSMYCPHCQREAPNVNALFKALSNRKELKNRVTLIGIGAGNTPYEVNAFRNLYKIQYPLFPDGDLGLHKKLGEVNTPYFFVVWNKPNAGRRVVYSKVGSIGDPNAFIQMISSKTGVGGRK
ncbi:MAG: TlpA family protein disulfide reductase [Desulfobacteraceae bacterium]|nr:TlpA family protein disulfide reductase [Desulfobacteraceae bacterium]